MGAILKDSFVIASAVLAAGLMIAGAILATAPRYSLANGGALRLDMRTGALMRCSADSPSGEHWSCK